MANPDSIQFRSRNGCGSSGSGLNLDRCTWTFTIEVNKTECGSKSGLEPQCKIMDVQDRPGLYTLCYIYWRVRNLAILVLLYFQCLNWFRGSTRSCRISFHTVKY